MQSPLVWQREYYPAQISWPSRSICTQLNLDSNPRPITSRHAPKKRLLGRYKQETWTLHAGAAPQRKASQINVAILDQVASITRTVSDWYDTQRLTAEQKIESERDRAYLFLLDRAYLLRNGVAVATYRQEVPWFLAQVAALGAVQATLGKAWVACLTAEEAPSLRGFAKSMALGMPWLLLTTGLFFTMVHFGGDDPTLANMFAGPSQKRKLNKWALELAPSLRNVSAFKKGRDTPSGLLGS